ncbi:MAG: hypothetical protein WBD51_18195 [Burkholderiaceae bacterium]
MPEVQKNGKVTGYTGRATRIRHGLAGVAVSVMLILAIGNGLFGDSIPHWWAGIAAWMAAVLLAGSVARGQQFQIGTLMLVGLITLVIAAYLGGQPHWVRILDANSNLLTMIAAVSFLRLVTLSDEVAPAPLPVGVGAYRRTLLGVALFGTFINLSAPILITDRLAQSRSIDRFTSQSITRVFSGCSSWSPFFAGMAVVLTYLPETKLAFVMAACFPFAVAGFVLVNLESSIRYREEVRAFKGYAVTFSNLWVPVLLAITVLFGVRALPQVSILLIIAISSLLISITVLFARHGRQKASKRLSFHITGGLSGMAGEILLFTSAGVLAVGLTALVDSGRMPLPMTSFSYITACVVLVVILVISMIGIHPVITIAGLTPLLLPLSPDPQLLAVTYLFGWSLGTCASPLSGTHVVFQGRYGVPAISAAVWNWPFALVMCIVAFFILAVVSRLSGL